MVVQIDSKNKSTQGLGRVVSTTAYQSLGCTDPTATNYNSGATVDDGSCCYTPGCTDPVASNYDAAACFNDGTCNYDVVGCMDINYQEYNSNANISDQQMCLTLITVGCTDASQTTSAYGVTYNTYYNYGNYDVTCTTCDNITAPNCCCLPHVPGCTNPGSNNYDPTATINDGSCDNGIIYGCMDATALNYDSNATNDSGDCCYYGGCTNPTALNYSASACFDDGSCIPVVEGCTDATANNYDAAANTDNGTCTYNEGCTDQTAVNYDATAVISDNTLCCYNAGCMDPTASNYDLSACQEDGSCVWNGCMDPNYVEFDSDATVDDGTFCITLIVYGCTDDDAPNYDPAATNDDGSCGHFGCTDPTACNYDATAGGDDGSCILPDGCTDPNASNYDPNATCDDGTCEACIYGCTDVGTGWGNYNYNSNATCDDGSCAQGIVGCNDPTACNYDPDVNNGWQTLCNYGADGCTDPTATNFDPNASCDDGSCTPCVNGCMDPNQGGYDQNADCNDPSDCNYGYGGNTWTGANDDTTHWIVNGDNTLGSVANTNINITKNPGGNNNNYVKLNTNTHLNKDLFRGDGSYYMVQFDARTSPGDDVKMRIYADAPTSSTITSSESIYYYGDNNIYKTFYLFFEALPYTGNANDGPANYSLRTTSFNTGETVYIKNIKVRQNKLDINNILYVNVNSIIHPTSNDDGKYFYFSNQSMELLLEQPWSNEDTVDVIQVRNGLPIKAGTVKIWDYNSNNSTPEDANDIISNSHGRWEPSNEAAAGDWQIGDKIILTLP